MLADIALDGAALRVVGMHLDLSGLWRRRQAQAILAHLAERDGELPTVLMGDLNEWSTRGGCLRDFAAHHLFAPCGRSFHARRPIAQLDQIMVTPDLEILASGAHASPPRGAPPIICPIWADLRVGDRPRRAAAAASAHRRTIARLDSAARRARCGLADRSPARARRQLVADRSGAFRGVSSRSQSRNGRP